MSWGEIYNTTHFGAESNKRSILEPQRADVPTIKRILRRAKKMLIKQFKNPLF